MESFTMELVAKASAYLVPEKRCSSSYKYCSGATGSGNSIRGCNLRNVVAMNVPKCYRGEFHVFDEKLSKCSEFYFPEPGFQPCNTYNVEAMNTLIHERHNHSESCITFYVEVCRKTQKVDIYLAIAGFDFALLVRTCDTFLEVLFAMNFEWCLDEKDFTNQTSFKTLSTCTLMIYTDLTDRIIVRDYWTLHELSDL